MNTYTKAFSTVALALLSAGFLSGTQARTEEMADSEQVNQLLSETKSQAFELKEDAASLQLFTSYEYSWQSHVDMVNRIKDHILAVSKQEAKLEELRSVASPWQRNAIDRIQPMLKEMAATTDKVIEHLNSHPNMRTSGQYREYVEANSDLAAQLSNMISDYVGYGKAKQRAERLGTKLELPASSF